LPQLVLRGRNFGGAAAASIGVQVGASAAGEVLWVSDAEIWCNAAAGVGTGLPVSLRVAGRAAAAAPSALLSYDPPLIAAVEPSLAPVAAAATVTVLGYNFGPAGDEVLPRGGPVGVS
jgi:hypothetical protein